jgi:aryl-alcohol dehydrogenase-like predicted oxidoreductase
MKSKGYIRFWGISCAKIASADDAHQAVGREGVAVVQIPASCVQTLHTAALAREAAARGVALVGRQPFGHGDLLTSQVQPEWAASPVCTPARTALTYALRLEGLASVLVGMRRYEHLHESVDTVACLSVTRQS